MDTTIVSYESCIVRMSPSASPHNVELADAVLLLVGPRARGERVQLEQHSMSVRCGLRVDSRLKYSVASR
eukprot:394254-Prymnesium_polylepis.1